MVVGWLVGAAVGREVGNCCIEVEEDHAAVVACRTVAAVEVVLEVVVFALRGGRGLPLWSGRDQRILFA